MLFADIIVDISHDKLDKTFQYIIPEELVASIRIGVMVNIPFGAANRLITGYVVDITDVAEFDIAKLKQIDSVAKGKTIAYERMIAMAAWMKHEFGSTMNQALKTVLPVKDTVREVKQRLVELCVTEAEARLLIEEYDKKHAKARVRLLEALLEGDVKDLSILKSKLNLTDAVFKTLCEKNVIRITELNRYRNPVDIKVESDYRFTLNEEQSRIVGDFYRDFDEGRRMTYLVHGVTGSGKTICYIEMIQKVIDAGKQVIVLIPEIALTYQTVSRFYRRFGDKVSILNSKMSKGERYDQFMRALKGEVSIMIGPRSALFTPFSDIGLIVIDEEHEGTYKSEKAPRYDARRVAEYIADTCGASVILGSATPSLVSYYKALKGDYKLYTLKERAKKATLPTVYITDLREELREGNRSIFSRKLRELMEDRLRKKQQIMLFLNKRGYAGFVSCRSCGHVFKCPHCDVSMTIHNNGKLMCHYCGYSEAVPKLCPRCGSRYVSGFKAGTQQVEEIINREYPGVRVLRMDMDTTQRKDSYDSILSSFANHEADILIGTQMIVKGHDFPDVTLMGILAADMSLYSNEYTAAEKTFQLLVQAAGRAGRGETEGEVVIQSYTPEHYSIVTAANGDYEAFYNQEIAYRRIIGYPPIANVLKLTLSSDKEEELNRACDYMKSFSKELLREYGQDGLYIIGPVPAGIYKIKDYYTQQLHIKLSDNNKLHEIKDSCEAVFKNNNIFANILVGYDFN